jgi:hypothetical protein
MVCINYNAFGLVLHRYLWSGIPVTFGPSPTVYHELAPFRQIKCGWTLLQEFVWACSPHMNGSFRDYRLDIRACIPKAQ